jgi:hypothetical protein
MNADKRLVENGKTSFAGAHTIVVKKIGYKPWERTIDPAVGESRGTVR